MPFPPLIHHTEVIKNIPVFFSRKKVSVTASKPIISLLEVETLLQGKPSYLSFHTKTDIYSTVLSLADKRSSAVDRWNRIKKTCRPQCVKVASVVFKNKLSFFGGGGKANFFGLSERDHTEVEGAIFPYNKNCFCPGSDSPKKSPLALLVL